MGIRRAPRQTGNLHHLPRALILEAVREQHMSVKKKKKPTTPAGKKIPPFTPEESGGKRMPPATFDIRPTRFITKDYDTNRGLLPLTEEVTVDYLDKVAGLFMEYRDKICLYGLEDKNRSLQETELRNLSDDCRGHYKYLLSSGYLTENKALENVFPDDITWPLKEGETLSKTFARIETILIALGVVAGNIARRNRQAAKPDETAPRGETGRGEGEIIPWWKKIKRYFSKHQIWLIPAIVGFIGTIVGPIIVFVIQKKLGD